MKIEETYRDLKSLLGMTKLMNKQQVYMEKMVSLVIADLHDRFARW